MNDDKWLKEFQVKGSQFEINGEKYICVGMYFKKELDKILNQIEIYNKNKDKDKQMTYSYNKHNYEHDNILIPFYINEKFIEILWSL